MYENRGKQKNKQTKKNKKNNVLETSLDMIVFLVCVCFFGFFVCVLIYEVIIFGSYLKQTVYKQTCVYKHVGLMSG